MVVARATRCEFCRCIAWSAMLSAMKTPFFTDPVTSLREHRHRSFFRQQVPFLLILALICGALYGWTLNFPLVFDDFFYLTDNPLFKAGMNVPTPQRMVELVKETRRLEVDPDLAYNQMLRPVAYATFHLNHFFDGFDPTWYRAFNIMVHLLNAVMVWALVSLLTGVLADRGELNTQRAAFISRITAVLFMIHPMAVESVTYVVQRFTSLGAFWYLASLLAYMCARSEKGWKRVFLISVGLLAMFAGMLTKEDCFTAPVMLVVMEVLFFRIPLGSALRRTWPLIAMMAIIPLIVVFLSYAGTGESGLLIAMQLVDRVPDSWGIAPYFITQTTVVAGYIFRLVWPADLCLTPNWEASYSLWAWKVLAAIAFHATLLLGSVTAVYNRPQSGVRRFIAVFLIWFYLTVSVSSSVVPLPDLVAWHRTYLPSIGLFVLAAYFLDGIRLQLVRWMGGREWGTGLALSGVLTLMIGYVTVQQNRLWQTNVSLWSHCVSINPRTFVAWNNLGAAYVEARQLDRALDCFEKVIELEPRYSGGALNVSNVLLLQQRWRECHDRTVAMMQKDPRLLRSVQAIYNVGSSLIGLERYDEGLQILEVLVANQPGFLPAHKVMGLVYKHRGNLERARYHLALCGEPVDAAGAQVAVTSAGP